MSHHNEPSVFRGDRLRTLRQELGFSLEDVARLSASSKSYVWELERNAELKPSCNTLLSLSKALGVTMEWLCGENDDSTTYAAKIGAIVLKAVHDRKTSEKREQLCPACGWGHNHECARENCPGTHASYQSPDNP